MPARLPEKPCQYCNQNFKPRINTRRFCSYRCKSLSQLNQVDLICKQCGKSYRKAASIVHWAKVNGSESTFCSKTCEGISRQVYLVDDEKNFQKIYDHLIRTSGHYKRWRREVFIRDRYTCQSCGYKREIEAHHIFRFAHFPEFRFTISNGVTFCHDCHAQLRQFDNSFRLCLLEPVL